MSKTNIFIAVALINIVVIAGIVNELGLGDDEVDTSTIVTAKLSIYYKNAGDNDTLIFESLDLNSMSVPPLKSIPKFKPLNIKKNKETTTKEIERILNLL